MKPHQLRFARMDVIDMRLLRHEIPKIFSNHLPLTIYHLPAITARSKPAAIYHLPFTIYRPPRKHSESHYQ